MTASGGGRFARPNSADDRQGGRWRLGKLAVRVLVAAELMGVAIWLFMAQGYFQKLEVTIAHGWLGVLVHGTINQFDNVLFFPWVDGPIIGLRVSPECSVVLLLGPLLILGAALMALTRFGAGRLLFGLLAGGLILMMVNQLRLGVIAMSLQRWGILGYDVSHQLVATLIGLAGFVTALFVTLRLAAGPGGIRGRRRRVS